MASSTVAVRFTGDADNLNRTIRGVEDSTGRLNDRMRGFATGIAGAVGGAFAVGSVVNFGDQMLTLGGQLETMRAKVSTVFGASAESIRRWADANNESFGVTDDQLAGMAANFGDLLKPMGFTSEQAAAMSQEMIGLGGALSSWSGGTRSAAEVSEILQGAMLGETDALQGLGIAISANDVEARLAANGQAELTGAAREQAEALAIQQLIMEKSADAQAAWAAGGSDAMAAQNSLGASVGELKERLAGALTPALTAVAGWLGEHLPVAMAAASNFMNTTLKPAFEAIVGWVRDNWPQIQAVISEVLTQVQTVVGGFVDLVTAAWNAFGDNIMGAIQRVWPPIQQTVQGALDVVRGIIQTVTSLISGDWSGVWDGIKQILGGAWDFMVGRVQIAIEAVRFVLSVGLEIITGLWSGVWNGIKDAFGGLWDGIKNTALVGITLVKDTVSGVLDTLRGIWEGAWTGLRNFVNGLWSTMGDGFRGVVNTIIGALEGGINSMIRLINMAIDALDSALGPWINFGEISEVSIPRLSAPAAARVTTTNVQRFDNGGIVPGALGSPSMILAHGGETVLPTHKMGGRAALAAVGAGGDTFNLNNVTIVANNPEDLMDQLLKIRRQNGAGMFQRLVR